METEEMYEKAKLFLDDRGTLIQWAEVSFRVGNHDFSMRGSSADNCPASKLKKSEDVIDFNLNIQ